MNNTFKKQIKDAIERHLPIAFLDYRLLELLIESLAKRKNIGRKELLIIAYLIGATVAESNELLRLAGHPTLYVKRREDAIWRFMLNHQLDSRSIINEIFPQNVDEKKDDG